MNQNSIKFNETISLKPFGLKNKIRYKNEVKLR
jgi:hypothetical protein